MARTETHVTRQGALRTADLAGAWYPDAADACRRLFDDYERYAVHAHLPNLVAGVVPHAGWLFSGALAYNVLRELACRHDPVETVVLFAGHLPTGAPFSVMAHGACETPLGPIATDEPFAREIAARLDIRQESPENHSQDNSAEVHFPMIKHLFPDARLLILGAPPRPAVFALADAVLDTAHQLERRIVAVGSTDLTHYGPRYSFTPHGVGIAAEQWVRQVNDRLFIDAACAGDPEDVLHIAARHSNACCAGAAAATMHLAARLDHAHGEPLRYATSADVQPATSFVGYAAIAY